MGTMPALQNPLNPTGVLQAWNNLGKPVTNNTGTAMPTFAGATTAVGNNPFAVSAPPQVPTNAGGLISGRPAAVPMAAGAIPVAAATGSGTISTTSAPSSGQGTGNVNAPLQNQLNDIFGPLGNVLAGEIANLGSENSAYLKAYENAIAPINAENLATLQTTLGNEGISADSSVAAIAQADFQSQIAAKEGELEQQLTMQDIQDLLGLTASLEKPAEQQQAQSSPWSIISKIISAGGAIAGDIFGGPIGGAVGGALGGLIPSASEMSDAAASGAAAGFSNFSV